MEITPHGVRTVEFGTARKGLDPEQVRTFLAGVADELERAQNQATAMEARARAAVARLQELTSDESETPETASTAADQPMPAPVATSTDVSASVAEAETISRTMLLAQRSADLAVAEAEAEATRLREEAAAEAAAAIEQAKSDARSAGEAEREIVESEVNALIARRDFLESDVDHMERFLADQRTRLRDAAAAMIDLADRAPAGLGEVRRPLLSASDDTESLDATAPYEIPVRSPDGDTDSDVTPSDADGVGTPGPATAAPQPGGSAAEPTPDPKLSFGETDDDEG